jgi:hypothetical protein
VARLSRVTTGSYVVGPYLCCGALFIRCGEQGDAGGRGGEGPMEATPSIGMAAEETHAARCHNSP